MEKCVFWLFNYLRQRHSDKIEGHRVLQELHFGRLDRGLEQRDWSCARISLCAQQARCLITINSLQYQKTEGQRERQPSAINDTIIVNFPLTPNKPTASDKTRRRCGWWGRPCPSRRRRARRRWPGGRWWWAIGIVRTLPRNNEDLKQIAGIVPRKIEELGLLY